MSSKSQNSRSNETQHSIPLQDLRSSRNNRANVDQSQSSSTPPAAGEGASLPTSSALPHAHSIAPSTERVRPESPIDPTVLQAALPPQIPAPLAQSPRATYESYDPYDESFHYIEEASNPYYTESDRIPLTAEAHSATGSLIANRHHDRPRHSFNVIPGAQGDSMEDHRSVHLGANLDGEGRSRHSHSYGMSLAPDEHRRRHSSSTSVALSRAGSIVRAMSQRVVNLSGESEVADQQSSRYRSRSLHGSIKDRSRNAATNMLDVDTTYNPLGIGSTAEKPEEQSFFTETRNRFGSSPQASSNPLRGFSLGIFSPHNRIRLKMCDLLVNPYTEPLILLLIILQAVLLALESGPSVFKSGNERPKRWGSKPIDWAMLALFIVFTLELFARIIVSGFILNAEEYSTIDRQKGIRAALADRYKTVFQPQRNRSVRGARQAQFQAPVFARSFTTIMHGQQVLPETLEDQQRFQLARRAFLRHSFNRLDFVAVVSFWIAFGLAITGLEHRHHLYLFKMLSCLRILRLLALTHGTAIILSSLKKAAPLLLRVAFLISFFWLLFAIIGVQSFKSSLSRQCVWLDPLDPKNLSASFTNDMEFCGGHLDNETGATLPWVKFGIQGSLDGLKNGTSDGKGFLCPRGSICLQQSNPYNGTVNFDNILHSIELVFVIMSANTFSDLMYYTMGSDYSQAALFFGAGTMIMTLWLINLLIAVITSSFQVIREESKSSAFTVEQEPLMQLSEHRPRKPSSLQVAYEKTSLFWIFLIAFAMICEACRSATMSHFRARFISVAEISATILLDFEIVYRFIADWHGFHRSWSNIVDLGLAIITSVILVPPIQGTRAYAWLTFFQALRAYRVVLAIPITRSLILLVLGSAAGIGNLMLFVFLMTFLVAIFAAQLFRGQIPLNDDGGNLNRISFYTIFNSFLGMYQILSSENWTAILYSVTSYSTSLGNAWIGAIFLIGWFILAFFILINMFIAVIQENFDVSEDEKRLEQVKAFLQRKELGHAANNLSLSTIFHLGKSRRRKDPLDYGPAIMEMLLKDAVVREFLDDDIAEPIRVDSERKTPLQRNATTFMGDIKPGFLSTIWGRFMNHFTTSDFNPFYSNIRFDGPNDNLDPRQMARQVVSATSARRKAQREYLARHPRYNTSLYIFTPQSRIRRFCQSLMGPSRGSERFDGLEPNKIAWYSISAFVYAAVAAMVIIACVVTPLYQKQYREQHNFSLANWYVWTDMSFAIVFTIEAAIKTIADGLVWTPNAYLRSPWGIIDSIVLATLWINVVTMLINDGAISRAVGAFKALRALRLLNLSDSARDTFHSLIIVGWWKLFGAAFVSISLLIPFAIYGLNLFNGLMITCNDSNVAILSECLGEFSSSPFSEEWPMLTPRVASNPYFSFDDFGASLFTLFQIVSQEGWVDVSFAAQAITGRGMQPQDLASQGNAVFFVVFNLLATVFILTLFISIFMRNYTEQTGVAFLTAEQRSWLELRKLLRHISPSKSSHGDSEKAWKRWCHKRAIEKRGKWYQAVTAVLCLHLLLLVLEFNDEPSWWATTREYIFLAFVLVYVANISIRILGLSWSRFRRSSWDLYSLVSVSGAFVSTLVLLIADTKQDTLVQLHKFFLVAIILLVIPRNDALDQLFKTAAVSLPVIGNLLATWLVFFLVFAIAMTQTFSLTRFGENEGSDINFRTVPNALIFLFRMSLGEGWNQIMEDYAKIEPPLCVENANSFFESDCGSKPWARFLFVAWNIVSMYIFVNLFVSLIYESFSYVYQRSSSMSVVDRDEIRRFKEAWRSVDPAGSGYITKEAFPRLLGELSGVFEMRIYAPEDSIRQILEDVRGDVRASQHTSMISINAYSDLNIQKLNERLAQLDVRMIRKRRHRFNIFYEEVLVGADPDKGIAFTDVLMILAHYNIINDSKSLKLEEFLRRRARLQRVDEGIRRRIVQGFFDTLYWSRKFKKHMERKRAARMTTIPYLGLPDILINEGDDESPYGASQNDNQASGTAYFEEDTKQQKRSAWSTEMTFHDSAQNHPLSFPQLQPTTSRQSGAPSAFSFELYEPDADEAGPSDTSRGGPAIGGQNVTPAQDMLDDAVWVDSILRSATSASDKGRYRFGDLD